MDLILLSHFKRNEEYFNAACQSVGRPDLRMHPEWGIPCQHGDSPMVVIESEIAFCKLPYFPKDSGWKEAVTEALKAIEGYEVLQK